MRSLAYEIVGLTLIGVSLYFFYQSVSLLGMANYVGALLTTVIGFLVIRVGVELSRLALFQRRQEGQ